MPKRLFRGVFDCRVVKFFGEEINMIDKNILVKLG